MQRVTITLEDELAEEIDRLVKRRAIRTARLQYAISRGAESGKQRKKAMR
jgi:metal-responsive CopG/Arc/MetJ family transcriptional regulator